MLGNSNMTISIFLLAVFFAGSVFAAEAPKYDVASYVLIDAQTGKILAEQNPHKQVMPASTTKIMTAYLVDKAIAEGKITQEQEVPIPQAAINVEGTRVLHTKTESVPVAELYQGMMINSGNDASIAFAELLAGNEENFSELMNQEAARLGMRNTHFVNASGLPHPEHYSSAYDLAILAQALIAEYPESYAHYSKKSFTYNDVTKRNTNHMLLKQDPTVDGVKTGYTIAAKHCLVASAKRGDVRLIAAVMKAPSQKKRADYVADLLDYGFDQYETKKIYTAHMSIAELPVSSGKETEFQVGLTEDLSLTLTEDDFENLTIVLDVPKSIEAPVDVNEPQGYLIASLGDMVVAKKPIVSLEKVEEKGWFAKIFS